MAKLYSSEKDGKIVNKLEKKKYGRTISYSCEISDTKVVDNSPRDMKKAVQSEADAFAELISSGATAE